MIKEKVAGVLIVFSILLYGVSDCAAAPAQDIAASARCAVCGMFVAKYPAWSTEIIHQSGKAGLFDGVKDMMVYFFHPEQYGAAAKDPITEIWVKDYYSLSFIDAKKAFFVTGSDVYGPMGHEFIPFSSKEAAEAFLNDHKGKNILTFDEITSKEVESMRVGQKMK